MCSTVQLLFGTPSRCKLIRNAERLYGGSYSLRSRHSLIMNMRTYYQKIRDIEQAILEPVVILESNETADGGKEGLLTEVPKRLAAKMIVDGRARLANEQPTREFHEKKAEAKRTADQEAITNKMQMMLVPTAELMKT